MNNFNRWLFIIALINLFSLIGFAQVPSPSPTPPDEKINILTEEVRLNVTAQYSNGKFVPNLTIDDLLVVESGDPQTITSMNRVPAQCFATSRYGKRTQLCQKHRRNSYYRKNPHRQS